MSREREANTMGKNELQSFTIWFVLPNARSTAADPAKSAMMEQIIQWHVISISMLFSTNTKNTFFSVFHFHSNYDTEMAKMGR